MFFYKYTKSEYLGNMINKSVLRIGTLHEYWGYENEEIGDKEEGSGSGNTYVTTGNFNKDDLPGLFKYAFQMDGDSTVKLTNVEVESRIQMPNAYIYCLTQTLSKPIMKKFGYDACIQISDVKKLREGIALAMFNLGLLPKPICFVHHCFYEKREITIMQDSDFKKIYWLKDPKFKHQDEYRLVLPTHLSDLKPIIIEVPNIKRCLHVIEI